MTAMTSWMRLPVTVRLGAWSFGAIVFWALAQVEQHKIIFSPDHAKEQRIPRLYVALFAKPVPEPKQPQQSPALDPGERMQFRLPWELKEPKPGPAVKALPKERPRPRTLLGEIAYNGDTLTIIFAPDARGLYSSDRDYLILISPLPDPDTSCKLHNYASLEGRVIAATPTPPWKPRPSLEDLSKEPLGPRKPDTHIKSLQEVMRETEASPPLPPRSVAEDTRREIKEKPPFLDHSFLIKGSDIGNIGMLPDAPTRVVCKVAPPLHVTYSRRRFRIDFDRSTLSETNFAHNSWGEDKLTWPIPPERWTESPVRMSVNIPSGDDVKIENQVNQTVNSYSEDVADKKLLTVSWTDIASSEQKDHSLIWIGIMLAFAVGCAIELTKLVLEIAFRGREQQHADPRA